LDSLFTNTNLPINTPASISQTQAPALPAQQPNTIPINLDFFETTTSHSQSYNQSIYENIPADNSNWSTNGYRADNLFASTNVSQTKSVEPTTTNTNTLASTNRSVFTLLACLLIKNHL
jgi:hypothetical protein